MRHWHLSEIPDVLLRVLRQRCWGLRKALHRVSMHENTHRRWIRLSFSNVWAVSCWNHKLWITITDTSSSCPDRTFPGRCDIFEQKGDQDSFREDSLVESRNYTHVRRSMLTILQTDGNIVDVEHTNTHRIRLMCLRDFVLEEKDLFFFPVTRKITSVVDGRL